MHKSCFFYSVYPFANCYSVLGNVYNLHFRLTESLQQFLVFWAIYSHSNNLRNFQSVGCPETYARSTFHYNGFILEVYSSPLYKVLLGKYAVFRILHLMSLLSINPAVLFKVYIVMHKD